MRRNRKAKGFHINPRIILGLIGTLVYLAFVAFFLLTAIYEPHTVKYQPDNMVFLGATIAAIVCCAIRKRLSFLLVLISHGACIIIGNVTAAEPSTAAIIHCSICALIGLFAIWLKKGSELMGEISDGHIDVGSMIGDEYTSEYDGTEG